jgi:trigger factor
MAEEQTSTTPAEASPSPAEASPAQASPPPAEAAAPADETQLTAEPAVPEIDAEPDFDYPTTVVSAGPATKKVHVEIPEQRIKDKLAEQFKDLRKAANIPGFRAGHAPQKLVEKRFAADVKEQVRRQLIGESYRQALAKNTLTVVGEPEFDTNEKIELPDQGDLRFSFSVEVQPEITLPSLEGLKVRKPRIGVSENHIDQAMNNLRQQNGGALVPVEDRGVEAGDYLTADAYFRQDDKEIMHFNDTQLIAGKVTLGGMTISDAAEQLAGAKPGEQRAWTVHVPADYPIEAIRDKDVRLEVTVKDIKKLELPEVNQEFLESLGFENVQELRDALKERLAERIDYDVQQAMREQVAAHLLSSVQMELPARLSERQATRMAGRRAVELMMRGMTREQVMSNFQALKAAAQADAFRELKQFFILQKLAGEQKVQVDEAELNNQVAMLALRQGKRPEKVKHEMAQDGSLQFLYVRLREEKALDNVIARSEIEEVDPPQAVEGDAAQQ